MEERRSSPNYQPKYTRNDEIHVASILNRLTILIDERDYGFQLPLSWGSKRWRSADVTSCQTCVHSPSPQLVPSFHSSGGLLSSSITALQAETSSPATPLSFCTSETDEKPRCLKKLRLGLGNIRREESHLESETTVGYEHLVPDLNITPGESRLEEFAQPVEENRALTKALAAQARQRRMEICRKKKPSFGRKLHLPRA